MNEKKKFVSCELKSLCQKIDENVLDMYYIYIEERHEEFVNIRFKNGYERIVCVTADSLKAITKDVIRVLG